VIATLPVGRDVVEAVFQPGSPFVALHRRGGVVEIWDAWLRRLAVGPLTVPEPQEASFTEPSVALGGFLAEPGRLLLAIGATPAQGAQLRWYRAGTAPLERSLDFGVTSDITFSGPQPLALSADGNTALFAVTPEVTSILPASQPVTFDLRPEAWQDALCDWIEGRRFTDTELATLPDGTDAAGPC
jgi:hypothetical protein